MIIISIIKTRKWIDMTEYHLADEDTQREMQQMGIKSAASEISVVFGLSFSAN